MDASIVKHSEWIGKSSSSIDYVRSCNSASNNLGVVNQRFVSVLIDKDDDYITKRNATFDMQDVHRFRNEAQNLSSSCLQMQICPVTTTAAGAIGCTSNTSSSGSTRSSTSRKPTVHKSNSSNRHKFYRWSNWKKLSEGGGAGGLKGSPSRPQRIASSLGLISKKRVTAGSDEEN